jgi:hypothetical protein
MAVRDLLAGEAADAQRAIASAQHGRSLTGLSGRHTDVGAEPIAGERVERATHAGGAPIAGPPGRVPFGAMTLTMQADPRPGFHRHWFNDEPGRVDRAKLAGYTHVQKNGEPMSMIVGKDEGGRGKKAYLMEIPQEWYDSDMAAQQAELEAKLAEIRHGRGGPGGDDPTRYVPQQGRGINIRTSVGPRR